MPIKEAVKIGLINQINQVQPKKIVQWDEDGMQNQRVNEVKTQK